MANTVTRGTHGITIVFDGSTAWEYNDEATEGLVITSLMFVPTATDDTIKVREGGSATGRIILQDTAATAYDSTIKYFNNDSYMKIKPYVVGNEVSAGVTLIIDFK